MATLLETFEATYGKPPKLVVRAPGRVNLIGEHTDYNGLPVMPMAIDRAITIAAAQTDRSGRRMDAPTVTVASTEPRHTTQTFALRLPIEAGPAGDWANYVKAAARYTLQRLEREPNAFLPSDLLLLVSGDIPAAAGLSSSSALVVASALALLELTGQPITDRVALASDLAHAERYVGTESGGMDQAICLLAKAGCATRFDFDPLRPKDIPLPKSWRFVISHSLVEARKAVDPAAGYNLRVAECRLATLAFCYCEPRKLVFCEARDPRFARSPGFCEPHDPRFARALPARGEHRELRHLGDLLARYPDVCDDDLLAWLPFSDEPLGKSELSQALGCDRELVEARLPPSVRGADRFAVKKRARHVISEARRVEQAERAAFAGDMARFGALMDASHRSCRDDYDISCDALEALVAAAKAGGASGSRLTGAGFGGCTVSLVDEQGVGALLHALEQEFYAPRGYSSRDCCQVVRPADAARVEKLDVLGKLDEPISNPLRDQ
jgi:N-acetylgalactosamine kinase